MEFTFGIITDGNNLNRVISIIESIKDQNILNFQIVIVGGYPPVDTSIDWIEFNESIKPKWITKKKNIITQYAKYENIVFMHDYIRLMPNWYIGMEKFGNNWDICMTQILNVTGERFRDWVIWADKDYIADPSYNGRSGVYSNITKRILPSYTYNKIENMYISGAYFIVKKKFMEENPLDESLIWGQGEDVEWYKRIMLLSSGFKYVMNPNSKVKLMKYKNSEAELI